MFRPSALAALTVTLALSGSVESMAQTTSRHGGSSRALIGTIADYDDRTSTLTVEAQSGRRAFVLGSDTPVRQGSRVLEHRALGALKGSRVKVRYLVNGSQVTVESVMVADENDDEADRHGPPTSGR
jgi:hypothetical protein